MSAYVIVKATVSDPEQFGKYREAAGPTSGAHGGEVQVRGAVGEVLEGSDDGRGVVVIKFPSVEQAKSWWNSPEYRAAAKLREGAAEFDVILVEGV